MLVFRLLGPVVVEAEGEVVGLGPAGSAKALCVLAVLLRTPGRPVATDALVERVWGDRPPGSAVRYKYVGWLRSALAPHGVALSRRADGYVLDVAADQVDLHRFRRLVDRAHRASGGGDEAGAAALLEQALALWRGEALAGVPGAWAEMFCGQLGREQRDARVRWARCALAVGLEAEALHRLTGWETDYPLDEEVIGLRMAALHRLGQHDQALVVHERALLRLRAALGNGSGARLEAVRAGLIGGDGSVRVEARGVWAAHAAPAGAGGTRGPGPGVRPALHGIDLRAARTVPAAVAPAGGASGAPVGAAAPTDTGAPRPRALHAAVAPRQLPHATRHFTGRRAELAALDALLAEPPAAGTVLISTIGGGAGIGKTALAVHWAHKVAARFPDGQLFVDLRGFSPGGGPMAAEDAVRGFLDALGVDPQRVPAQPQAQAALYRSALAGRRMLVVLDNARDSDQVRPLLPGSSGCMVLVTSRDRLTGMAATEGARHLALDLLARDEARDLLTRLLGEQRAHAEPAAVSELIALCARHPLALSVAAARAAARPARPLSALAAELGDARRRLDVFTGGDTATDLRAVFSWSYRTLSPAAARMFRLIGLHSGPEITAPAAASLAGVPVEAADTALDELLRAHLLSEPAAGRFTGHDLLHAYAAEQARAHDAGRERRTAVRRLLDHYLHTAWRAALLLDPDLRPPDPGLPPALAGVQPEPVADRVQALGWFEAHHAVLLGAIALAASEGADQHARWLPPAVAGFLGLRGRWHDWEAAQRVALLAAGRLGDPRGLAEAHDGLALPLIRSDRPAEAQAHLHHALVLYRRLGDHRGQAYAHSRLTETYGRSGRYDDALRHAERALRLFEESGDRAGRAGALTALGRLHALRGDQASALVYGEESVLAHRGPGNVRGRAEAWAGLGRTCQHAGRPERARDCYRRALDLYRERGERYDEAEVLVRLGDLEHAAGDPGAARTAWQRARDLLEAMGHADAAAVRGRLGAL
ncbi:BTAD domain-containing putative transcriptional regulator [Streptomyces sp. V4-01]|uniref:BTAD domain-containing putative transcriptional regulator n=1 Tax=Actinacidiphila polyblastidii TaxID=3110430 RepID=A0ABU7PKJ3_9ACTN|nr:BTAD domain-containing putative transcriptional regulator [Streptomyces sp. V4-01]